MCIRDRYTADGTASKNTVTINVSGGTLDTDIYGGQTYDGAAAVSYTHLDVYKRQDVPPLNTRVLLTASPVSA